MNPNTINDGQQIISSTNFGDITISNEEIKNYMDKHLDYMTDFEVVISSMAINLICNQKYAFQLIVFINKNQEINLEKLIHIRSSVEIILRNYIGVNVESINIGVKYIHD